MCVCVCGYSWIHKFKKSIYLYIILLLYTTTIDMKHSNKDVNVCSFNSRGFKTNIVLMLTSSSYFFSIFLRDISIFTGSKVKGQFTGVVETGHSWSQNCSFHANLRTYWISKLF